MSALTRRAFLGAAAALAGAGPAAAQVQASPRFSRVDVDVSTLHARGLGAYADHVRSLLLGELRRAFADRLGGPGPALVVRITAIQLTSFAGGGGGFGGWRGGFGSSSGSDWLEGEALVVGPRREVVARIPQLISSDPRSGGAWYDPASEQRRAAVLAQNYALWLRRRLG